MSGRVTDAESGRPLANAVVLFAAALSGAVTPEALMAMEGYQAVTGPDGRYALASLPAGQYTVRAIPPSFTATHLAASPGGRGGGFPLDKPSLTLAPGESRVDLDIALPRAYGIDGRVTDGSGAPMAGVIVHAELGPGWHGVSPIETDDRGVFRVYGLPPGTYRVCASPERWLPAERLGDRAVGRLVSTCYPAATVAGAAHPLTITNADLTGIDIAMQRGGAYTLSGEVVDASGALARDAQIAVEHVEGGGYSSIHAEIHDGRFIVRNLTDGEYRIGASTGSREERGRTHVRVEGADIDGVIVRTSPGVTVRGRVVFEGSPLTTAELGRLRIGVRRDLPLRAGPMRANPSDARVAGDLTFELTRLFDPVILGVTGLPDGWVVKSMNWEGADVTDRAVEFVPSPTVALRVVLTDRVARLRVRLAEPTDQPVPPSLVLVAPADPARFEGGLRADGTRIENGEIDFGAVAPGDYLVAAVALDVRLMAVDGPSSLEPLFRGALRVTLAEGDARVVEVQVSSPSGR